MSTLASDAEIHQFSCPGLLCRPSQRKRQRTLATDSAGEEDVDVKAEPESSGLQPLVSPSPLPPNGMAHGNDHIKRAPSAGRLAGSTLQQLAGAPWCE